MNKTRKINNKSVIISLLQFSTNIKILHWNTKSYNLHLFTDELYTSLSKNIDTLVELLLGSTRLNHFQSSMQIGFFPTNKFFNRLHSFKKLILSLRNNQNIANICDDILNDIDHFIYKSHFNHTI
jgi:DNA-binding ferritin-like protein